MIDIVIPGIPVPQARSRHRIVTLRNGKQFVGQYDPAESRTWKATVAEFAAVAMRGAPPLEGPVEFEAVFVFLPPSGWSRKKLALLDNGGEVPKSTKPDLKNLIAGVEDGIAGIVLRDDGQIWHYGSSRKVYGLRAEVRVTVRAAEEVPSNGTRGADYATPTLPLMQTGGAV
jgi:Holliday junction resolvase RusA-like endonuclease